ncbi:MAG: metallophosphoesterase [Gemmataceae bacterium]|nr:metallophosphoesterase [Gemmataceae bacterium]
MRIGLLTDIHEAVDHLRTALAVLAAERVDVIAQLGDVCDLYGPDRGTAEVVRLLAAAGAVGVWGNHDIGLCHEVAEAVRQEAEPHVLAYMGSMRGRLELGGCHLSHVDPHLDPTDALQLWSARGQPDAATALAAVPHRVSFIGHYHRWRVSDEAGPVLWDAAGPLTLDPARRFLVVVGPLVSGHFGVYDTDTAVLTPFRC